jgi:hypothetical protein
MNFVITGIDQCIGCIRDFFFLLLLALIGTRKIIQKFDGKEEKAAG